MNKSDNHVLPAVALTTLLLAGFATVTVAQDNVFLFGIEYATEKSVSGFEFLDEIQRVVRI